MGLPVKNYRPETEKDPQNYRPGILRKSHQHGRARTENGRARTENGRARTKNGRARTKNGRARKN